MTVSEHGAAKQRALLAIRDYGVQLRLFQQAVDARAGLNATDGECLRMLFASGSATPSALARHTGLTSGATTAMLDRLEQAGLIERRANPSDRRGSLVSPTPTAAAQMASWFASARAAQNELMSSYSADEQALIADVFERFARLWAAERAAIQRLPSDTTAQQ